MHERHISDALVQLFQCTERVSNARNGKEGFFGRVHFIPSSPSIHWIITFAPPPSTSLRREWFHLQDLRQEAGTRSTVYFLLVAASEEATMRDQTPCRVMCKDKQAREKTNSPSEEARTEQKKAAEVSKRQKARKLFERLMLHRTSNTPHLPLNHPFRLVAYGPTATCSALRRPESWANEYPASWPKRWPDNW